MCSCYWWSSELHLLFLYFEECLTETLCCLDLFFCSPTWYSFDEQSYFHLKIRGILIIFCLIYKLFKLFFMRLIHNLKFKLPNLPSGQCNKKPSIVLIVVPKMRKRERRPPRYLFILNWNRSRWIRNLTDLDMWLKFQRYRTIARF